ncbi:hypothetical protein Tco_0332399 [Tanacetum coccineum]
MNQFAEAVSSILGIVYQYLENKINDAVKTAVQLQSDRLREEAQAKNQEFINTMDVGMKKIIKEQVKEQVKDQVSKILPRIKKLVNDQLQAEVMTHTSTESKTSHAIAANLSEFELKKTLIDKMESNKRRDDADKDEEPSTRSNRGSKRRRAGKEPESTSAPKDKTPKSTGTAKEGHKSKTRTTEKSAQAEKPVHTNDDLEQPTHLDFNTGFTEEQPTEDTTQFPDWFQKPTRLPSPDRDWNKTLPADHEPI